MTVPQRAVCFNAVESQQVVQLERGIPRFIGEQLRGLYALDPGVFHSVLLEPVSPISDHVRWLLGSGLLRWTSDGTDRLMRRNPPAVYHLMSPFNLSDETTQVWPIWARDSRVATVVTLYDAIPRVLPELYLDTSLKRVLYEARLEMVRTADAVLAISESCKSDAVELLGLDPGRVHVIGAGTTTKLAAMHPSTDAAWKAVRQRFPAIRPGFVLYVGGFDRRKNLDGLVRAHRLLPDAVSADHQLVIVCRIAPEVAIELQGAARPGDVVFTGYVSDVELAALYRTCGLFCFASVYEGSGLPVLEAMGCGAAVASSNTSSMPELIGDLEATFDPREPAAISATLEHVLTSPETLERLRQRSRRRAAAHTWQLVAERTLAAYDLAIATVRRNRRSGRRPRIALVTPWAPDHSGIASYNERLVDELGRLIDVDIVVSGPVDRCRPPAPERCRLLPARQFEQLSNMRPYDRIVYCLGNSAYHAHAFELLRTVPGAAVLHDACFDGFYNWYARARNPLDSDAVARLIAHMYPERAEVPILDFTPAGLSDEMRRRPMQMSREVQRLAEECFVHSRAACDLLELDRDSTDRRAAVSILPFGMPMLGATPRGPVAPPGPLIASFGSLTEMRSLNAIVDAFALLAADHPGARFVITGYSHGLPEQWSDLAANRAPGCSVEVLPDVSEQTYRRLLAEARVAVQLRSYVHGEASASIADCLGAGLATIVTDAGWAAELPDDAVVKVPVEIPPPQLAGQIGALLADPLAVNRLSVRALEHAGAHDFAHVADAYCEALAL